MHGPRALHPDAITARADGRRPLPWISVAPGAPYFVDDTGSAWTPIGQNDAISWVEFAGLFRRRDLAGVDRHLAWLAAHGVTLPGCAAATNP